MIKLKIKISTIILKTNVLPNNVVRITVTKALIPNDCTERFHSTMPGIVANKHKIKPRIGNTCVTKRLSVMK